MKLFDEIERNKYKSVSYADALFTFLNRTASVEFDRIRRELEEWFSRYPNSGQADLKSNFCSAIDSQHQAAFFELFIHELLLRLGCEVMLHPSIPDVTKTPDFLVMPPEGENFYIEAKVATNESKAEAASHARINDVLDVLNREVDSPVFLYG